MEPSKRRPAEQNNRPHLLGVYDAFGHFVDTFAGTVDRDNTNLLTREFAGKTYMIEYTVDGFFNDTALCYTSGDCSGQIYFCGENPTTPPLAVYDGTVLGGNSGQNFNVPIFSAICGLGTGPCRSALRPSCSTAA